MSRLGISRDQLAKFLPSHELIKKFEQIIDTVDSIDTTNGITDANALASVNSILSQISELTDEIGTALVIVNSKINELLDVIETDILPPISIGTLGEQQADTAEITGGSITATLTNNQAAVTINSSVSLTDGAGVNLGTLATAPAAGNPTKWIGVNDNGVTRYIPAW